jgi:hypothetical protein
LPQAQWTPGYQTPARSSTAPTAYARDAAANGYYHTAAPLTNGSGIGMKRGRDDDDEEESGKRQRTEHDDGGPVQGVGGNSSPYAVNGGHHPVAAVKRR